MPRLSLLLLGSLQAALDGQPIMGFESNKVRALLAYLAVEADRPHSRDEVMGLLWPEQPDATARANLRQALANLRNAIGDRTSEKPFLSATVDSIQFHRTEQCSIDVVAFTELLAVCQTHVHRRLETCRSCAQRLQQAVELYRGDFLAPFVPSGSEAFEEWALVRRERLHRAVLDALYSLAEFHDRRSDYDHMRHYAMRQLELDPWREEAHRQLMRALALSGLRSAALAQYETCRRILVEELGAEPSQETASLQAQIKADRLTRAGQRHNLPAALTPLIGRKRELIEIDRLLEAPACRLLTLTGPGGIGKTRLALQAATEHIGLFADGVWLIELASLSEPALVLQVVATALGLREQGTRPLRDVLFDLLKPREVLLVLDNCEHLIEVCARIAADLLQACPQLSVLTTSREALKVAGEVIFQVPPLTTPDPQQLLVTSSLTNYEAVELFVERVVAAVPEFIVTSSNERAIAQICHQLDGMPLAIELTAARLKTLSVEQIATRLTDRFALLTNGSRTALPRHQTLRAAIDWSYDLLSKPERTLLRRLAVFAGGWTLEAAEAICVDAETAGFAPNDVLDRLTQLVNKSLVTIGRQFGRELRYHMLETIRQYAWERLLESGEIETVRTRHLAFFLELAEQTTFSRVDRVPLDPLESEYPNLRESLEWSLSSGQGQAGLRLASALFDFWHVRGQISEGCTWLKRALAIDISGSTSSRALALFDLGSLELTQGNFAAARLCYVESLGLWQKLDNRRMIAMALRKIGDVDASEGKYMEAQLRCEQSLAILRELADQYGLMRVLTTLGEIARAQSDYAQAEAFYLESLVLAEELGNEWNRDLLLDNLAYVAQYKGENARSQEHFQRMLVHSYKVKATIDCANYLAGLAGGARASGELRRAATLFAAVKSQLELLGARLDYADHAQYERNLMALRLVMNDMEFEDAWAEGLALTFEQAIEAALGEFE